MSLSPRTAVASVLAFGVAALGGVAAPPTVAHAAVSCYGGAAGWDEGDINNSLLGAFTTSSRCKDINLRKATSNTVFACVVFIDRGTDNCGHQAEDAKAVGNDWTVIASDVRNGTRFTVKVLWRGDAKLRGAIAY